MYTNPVVIGQNVKYARESNGFTQENVAEFLKVDQSLISKFEKGQRNLQSDMLEKLANLYGFNVSDIEKDGYVHVHRINVAYRSRGITIADMEAIHDIRRIAMNLFFMSSLLEGDIYER